MLNNLVIILIINPQFHRFHLRGLKIEFTKYFLNKSCMRGIG